MAHYPSRFCSILRRAAKAAPNAAPNTLTPKTNAKRLASSEPVKSKTKQGSKATEVTTFQRVNGKNACTRQLANIAAPNDQKMK